MPEQLSPELCELRDRVDAFATQVLAPLDRDPDLDPGQKHRATVAASKEAGLFSLTQPESVGGQQANRLTLTVVRDTLASHNVSHLPGVLGPAPGVLAGASGSLRSSHLAPLLAGDKRSAFAFTEPHDAERATWGVLEGDQLTIHGQKSYVTGGAEVDFLNTLVEIEGQGPALVVIDTDTEGVSIQQQFGSLDGSHHAHFVFDHVVVPVERIVGKPGEGLPRALRQIGDTRLAFAAESVGLARWVIDLVTDHLLAPHRSGNPLGAREGVRLRYADLRIQAFAARSMVYRTARLGDAGHNIVNETIACKVFATEAVGQIVDTAIQLLGGKALTTGHPLEVLYRRVRAMRLAEGASDILRLNLARGKLDLDKGTI